MCDHDKTHQHSGEVFILRLDRGEEVVSSIVDFCRENDIKGAWIQAIGAAEEVKLALYDLDNKEYHNKTIAGPLEIASIIGNIGIHEDEVAAHLHATVSNNEMVAFAGHLTEATVAATCEVRLEPLNIELKRVHDKDTGLNIINI